MSRWRKVALLSAFFGLVLPLGLGLAVRFSQSSALLGFLLLISPGSLFTLFSLSPLDPPDPPVLSFVARSIVAPAILNLCFYGALFSGLMPFERERAAPIAGALLILVLWLALWLGAVAAFSS